MASSSCLGKALSVRTAPASCQGRSGTRPMQTFQHGAFTGSRTWSHYSGSKTKARDIAVSAAASAGEDSERRMFGSMPIPPIILSAFVGHSKPSTQQSSATKSGEHATEQTSAMRSDSTLPSSSSPMPKTVMAANVRTPTGPMTSGGGGGGVAGGPPGNDGGPPGMISVADLDNMLADLKQSLHSIQASRAEYVELLSQRDATILDLSQQLDEKDRHIHQLEAQVRAMQVQLDASRQRTPPPPQPVARGQTPGIPVVIPGARPATPPPRTPQAVRASSPQQQAPRAPTPARSPPPTPEVVITYRTGWKQAYLHCNIDGKGWTVSPGIPMESVGNDMKQVRVPGSRLEFVVTNGKGDWDSPPGNYHIRDAGSYRLEFGKVHRA